MKRYFLSLLFVLSLTIASYGSHITGGEMSYILVSQAGNDYTYRFTLKLFSDPGSPAHLPFQVKIGVFDKISYASVFNQYVEMTGQSTIQLIAPNPCVISPPFVNYTVSLYVFNVTLPGSANGYVVSYQDCCRVNGIANLISSASYGVTYCAEIPGTSSIASGPANNSAHSLGIDTVLICGGYPFTYNFGAEDADGDSLVYNFCSAYTGTNAAGSPFPPPYNPVQYKSPSFSGGSPLGPAVIINSNTGMISGVAPAAGTYVVTVCVQEYRNGVLIATQRKDLQVKVSDCDFAAVSLEKDGYIDCHDYTLSFANLTPSSVIYNYFWDFGDQATLSDTSHLASPTYTYPDTGTYTIKVIANHNLPCSDSTTAFVRVYPGFFPDFDFTGICQFTPVQFNDKSTTAFGAVNSWRYNFGDLTVLSDTSRQQDPQYLFPSPGNYNAELIVGTSKGCRDTIYKAITIIDKPPITLTFRDTLICNDTLQLNATGIGNATWTPNYNIINAGSTSPLVFPSTTTWYTVEFNENGCINTDSVKIRAVNQVSLTVNKDTAICVNDLIQLSANTNGLQYAWSADPTLSDPTILNPIAMPAATTTYQIIASIGECTTTENVVVTVVSRPTANAGNDIQICYNSTARLNGQSNGTTYIWSPAASLSDPNSLTPLASPKTTTSYILTVTDNVSGCPKPTYDTITIMVLPRVNAFAGNDTMVFPKVPLQLKASGGISYNWSPAIGLNNSSIADPIVTLDANQQNITYLVTVTDQNGCVDTTSIDIKVYKTGPEIFVPTGFTPNNDGRNDVFRATYFAMKSIDYFQVYNRWGALIYSNNQNNGQGWDGTINGVAQNPGTFIWMVKATDVLGNVHFKKGTVMLIR